MAWVPDNKTLEGPSEMALGKYLKENYERETARQLSGGRAFWAEATGSTKARGRSKPARFVQGPVRSSCG